MNDMFQCDKDEYERKERTHDGFVQFSAMFTVFSLICLIFSAVVGIVLLIFSAFFIYITVQKGSDLQTFKKQKIAEYKSAMEKNRKNRVITSPSYSSGSAKRETSYKTYDDVKICVIKGKEPDYDDLYEGLDLVFKREPSNQYDSNAVAVFSDESHKKLGYLYRGTIQDMTNDFLKRGQTVSGELTEVDEYDDTLKMTMVFYK